MSHDPYAPIATLGSIPADIVQQRRAWAAPPLAQKGAIRVKRGAFLVTFCAYLAVAQQRIDGEVTLVLGGIGLVGLLWIATGLRDTRGMRDVMSGLWWGACAVLFGALLITQFYPAGWGRDGEFWLRGFYLSALAACALRCWVVLRPMPQTKLPHPSQVQGMPMAGPASPAAAHAALRRGRRRWWQFWA